MPNSWRYQMSILYRAEMKRIVKSHLNLINKVRQVLVDLCGKAVKLEEAKMPTALEGSAYKKMLLQETSHEVEEREEVLSNKKLGQDVAEAMLHKLDEGYQRARLVNAGYWK